MVTVHDIQNACKENNLGTLLSMFSELCKTSKNYNDFFEIMKYASCQYPDNLTCRDLVYRLFASRFKKDENAMQFLHNKLVSTSDTNFIADLIQTLGLMRYRGIIEISKTYITTGEETVRYKCIISLGWSVDVEVNECISLLSERLQQEELDYLRGYAATALRQFYFTHQDCRDAIAQLLYGALKVEKSELTSSMIIASLQTILKSNFGVKERTTQNRYEGNITRAKEKVRLFFQNR